KSKHRPDQFIAEEIPRSKGGHGHRSETYCKCRRTPRTRVPPRHGCQKIWEIISGRMSTESHSYVRNLKVWSTQYNTGFSFAFLTAFQLPPFPCKTGAFTELSIPGLGQWKPRAD